MFTSSSLRFAAWAGWHSAFGDAKAAESWAQLARAEWLKELAAGRGYNFLSRYNNDIYSYMDHKLLKKLQDDLLKTLKREIKKAKQRQGLAEKIKKTHQSRHA